MSTRGYMVTGQFFKKMGAVSAAAMALLPAVSGAQELGTGQPAPGQFNLQGSVTPIMDSITAFHDGVLMWTITLIVLFVLALLIIVALRFNAKSNPVPARFTHNTLIEIVWTVLPVLILVIIAIPSFGVLSDQMTTPDGDRKYLGANVFSMGEVEVPAASLTVKVSGEQWYWNYEYVDQGVGFDSNMVRDADLQDGQPRLLAVDNNLIVPVGATVRLQVTASPSGVIHAWAVPSFGVLMDAVPGRLNETWFNARETGMFYGQCRELCGKDHAYMPIGVRVVTAEQFDTFIKAFAESRDYGASVALLPAL
ncbi:cytochrome c oxidase subunit II [Devosia sp. MC521]|uniref:cytochrome c oxidase subunit II n=2 Tax=Devosia TaxID=46913 RepID=UPI0032C0D3FC